MNRVFFGLLLVLSPSLAQGSSEHYARGLQKRYGRVSQTAKATEVPGFQTDSPPETALNNHASLGRAMERAYISNPHVNDLKETAETRPYFRVDLTHDPVIKAAQRSVANPEGALSGEIRNRKRAPYTVHKCREAKPEGEFKCVRMLLDPTVHVDPAKYSNYWCTSGAHRPDDSRCRAKRYYRTPRKYQDEVIHITNEEWTSTCQTLEARADKGLCREIRRVCTDGPSSREVAATIGAERTPTIRKISRDCWREEIIYTCSHPSENSCEPLRQRSCEQYASRCITKIADVCVEWEQTYRCPDQVGEREVGEGVPGKEYHLPEGPRPPASHPNRDFNEAMAKLSVFDALQQDMRANGDGKSIHVFRGESRKCTIAFGSFKNCCGNGKGWGVSLNLSGCSGEEEDLAQRRGRKLCVELGTYCAEKLPVIGCIRKKRAYCCFPSKLSRILHEQGRGQIGKGWGDPEHPDCRGFSPEELSRLNFDALNLSELYSEIVSRAKQQTVRVVQRSLSDRVAHMTHTFKNQSREGGA